MKLETAYQVEELVRTYRDAQADRDRMDKVRDVVIPQGRLVQLTYLDNEKNICEIWDFDNDAEKEMLFDFLRDMHQQKMRFAEADLDKILPEIEREKNMVIRVKYEDVMRSKTWPNNFIPGFQDIILTDLPMSINELRGSDEVWLVSGAVTRRLWSKANPHYVEPVVPDHPDYVGAFQAGVNN